MTEKLIQTPIENLRYTHALIEGLKEENNKITEAVNEVLEVLNGKGAPNTEWIKKRLSEAIGK